MNRSFICILALAISAAALPAWPQTRVEPAEAPPMRFEWVTEGPAESCGDRCREWISATGRITAETPRDFEAFARTRDIRRATVVLDSNGGVALAGIALGRAFRTLELTSTVGKTTLLPSSGDGQPRGTLSPRADCASMCAFVLLGGARRHVPSEAQILVHQLWLKNRTEDAAAANYSAEEVVRVQREVGQIARYMVDMGGDIELFEVAMRVPPWEKLRALTNTELTRMRLHTADSAFSVRSTVASASPQLVPASVPQPRLATRSLVKSEFTTTDVSADRSQQRWAVVESFTGRELARRSMLTIEGEEIGTFRLSFGCGSIAGTLTITYSEIRKAPDPARTAHRLSDTILLVGSESVPLRIVSSLPRALGLSSIARGTLTVKTLKEFADGKTRSLLVATRMTDNARTAIRVGNTGLVALLDQMAGSCAAPARPS
jgi:hypothetical protein